MALLLLVPASDLAIAVVQRLVARLAPPRRLPRLDFTARIPPEARTLVVVPTLFSSVADVDELVEHLEVLALANLRSSNPLRASPATSPTRRRA